MWNLGWLDWLSIAVALGLFAYLCYALVRPENF